MKKSLTSPHASKILTKLQCQGQRNDCGPFTLATVLNALQDLNLDGIQTKQAQKGLEDANDALRRMVRETYKWLLAPVQEARPGKGLSEVHTLRETTDRALQRYVTFANHIGLYAECRMRLGTDAAEEVEKMAAEIVERYPRAVFFAGRMVFPVESFVTRLLHNETGLSIQRRLHFQGVPMVIFPIVAR